MANVSKINSYVQKWLITNPLILNISNPDNLKIRVSLRYNDSEIIARNVLEVTLDAYGIYKLKLKDIERNLIYKLITNVENPKIDIVVQFYNNNNTLASTDTKTVNIIVTNTIWVKENGTWKKATAYLKDPNTKTWKKGLAWYKNSEGVWNH